MLGPATLIGSGVQWDVSADSAYRRSGRGPVAFPKQDKASPSPSEELDWAESRGLAIPTMRAPQINVAMPDHVGIAQSMYTIALLATTSGSQCARPARGRREPEP